MDLLIGVRIPAPEPKNKSGEPAGLNALFRITSLGHSCSTASRACTSDPAGNLTGADDRLAVRDARCAEEAAGCGSFDDHVKGHNHVHHRQHDRHRRPFARVRTAITTESGYRA